MATDRMLPVRTRPRPSARERHTAATGRGHEVFASAAARLRRAVAYDSAAWFATDPHTLLPTSPTRLENAEPGNCRRYWERELLVEDVLLFRDLARAPRPVASLHGATDGNPARSARFREFLAPLGYGDEMRAVLRLGDRTWGVVDVLRDRARAPFGPRDVAALGALVTSVAKDLAHLATTEQRDESGTADAPGTAVVDPSGAVSVMDERAEHWFARLSGPDWAADEAFVSVLAALVSQAHAVSAGRDRSRAAARLRTPSGCWLILQASPLRAADRRPGAAAVVVAPARLADVASILTEAYFLTPREQEIARAAGRGLSTAEISRELFLSLHTVRDHFKTIFTKLGVTSRGELVAKLFADSHPPSSFATSAAS